MLNVSTSNVSMQALLDSGASDNFISFEFVKQNKFKYFGAKEMKVRLADGNIVLSKYICRLPIQFGKIIVSVIFRVLDSPIDVVLGMAWLRQSNPKIDWQ